ncbi:trigger factor [Flavobacterium psychraquaticum]|uniref:trigger factor n=1 Tax=Flavobacterium psychraquaticum TaxID=3103958 RepID=UPI002ACED24D|nr:trigger factor [Flavobacterium sp. LB-N7T]
MNITKTQVDALNAVITIAITREDYANQVEKKLYDYKKNAAISGFRKGAVPMSVIQKQYGKPVLQEEVNKVLQASLSKYLSSERLDILGNPVPKMDEKIDWNDDNFTFEFEIGLAPEFSVDLAAAKNVTRYAIIADDKMLNDQVDRIAKQYGKLISQSEVKEDFEVRGTFTNAENGINAPANFGLDIFADKKVAKAFIGKKVGDVVAVGTKGLFDDDHKLMDYLKIGHDDVHGLDITVDFTIEEINAIEKAEFDQELFDKLFGPGVISSIEELKAKIKEDAEAQFAQQADQKFLNDVTDALIENTKFDLPASFLKKWMKTMGETPLTDEQIEEEYAKAEKGLRFQLIEGRVMSDNKLQITFEDLKAHTAEIIKKQMAQFGQLNPSDEEVAGIVARVMGNQDEVKRLSEQVMGEKMIGLYNDKVKAKSKEVNYDQFIKEMYGE